MKRTWLMLLAAVVFFAVIVTPTLSHTQGDPLVKSLYAGSPHYYGEPGPKDPSWYFAHRTEVGFVSVWDDGTSLHVTYSTKAGWVLIETHLAVADDFADISQTSTGNPKIGRFPYKHEGLGGVTTDPYTIPLGSWGPSITLVIAAQAVVNGPCGQETAWANCGGPEAYFHGGSWATFFTYTVQ